MSSTTTTKEFTLVRDYAATPEELWQAWADPELATRWWHPRGFSVPRESVRIDQREGGEYAYTMVNDESGAEYPTVGVYREVVRPERLVFSWGSLGDAPEDCPTVTVTIEPAGEVTRMSLTVSGLVEPFDGIRTGWTESMVLLDDALVGAP